MSLGKWKITALAALGTATLLSASAASAQNVIVRSSGPSAAQYPAGKKLDNNASVKLASQDSVTVLGINGTRVLRGPGTFSLGDRSGRQAADSGRVLNFISTRGQRTARGGAVRGAGDLADARPAKPKIWYLETGQSGNFCVIDPENVVLWRPDYTGSATASIVAPATGKITKVEWREGSGVQAWPASEAPISNDANYRLTASGLAVEQMITFKVLGAQPNDEIDTAEMLVANGCEAQLSQLMALYESQDDSSGGTDNVGG